MKLYKYRSLDTWYDESKKVVTSGIDYCVDIINNYRLYLKVEYIETSLEGVSERDVPDFRKIVKKNFF